MKSPPAADENSSPQAQEDRQRAIASRRRVVRAFTLTELLVAVAILLILAALAAPVLGGILKRASTIRCASRMRQSAALLLLAGSENNNQLLVFREGTADTDESKATFWAYQVSKMLQKNQSLDILYCPECKPFRYESTNGTWFWDTYAMDMRENEFSKIINMSGRKLFSLKLAVASSPSKLILLCDSVAKISGKGIKQRFRVKDSTATGSSGSLHLRHGGWANVAFVDGHLELLSARDFKKYGFESGYDEKLDIVEFN